MSSARARYATGAVARIFRLRRSCGSMAFVQSTSLHPLPRRLASLNTNPCSASKQHEAPGFLAGSPGAALQKVVRPSMTDCTIPAHLLRQRVYLLHFYNPTTGQSAKLAPAAHYLGVSES